MPSLEPLTVVAVLREASIAYKLAAAAKAQHQAFDVSILRQVLGLADTQQETAYCVKLIDRST